MTTANTTPAPHLDNLFGVCAAIGETFGFNPFLLRLVLATSLLIDPWVPVIAYAALALAVLLAEGVTRLTLRPRRTVRAA